MLYSVVARLEPGLLDRHKVFTFLDNESQSRPALAYPDIFAIETLQACQMTIS